MSPFSRFSPFQLQLLVQELELVKIKQPYFATASPSISIFLIVVSISCLSYFPCMHAVEI